MRSRTHRHWLAGAGLALVLASLLLAPLARHYVYAESIQFCVFAMAGPARIVLGAPWRFLRLSNAPAADGPIDRLAVKRTQQTSFLRAALVLATFMAVSLAWRVPAVMDVLARHPALVFAEMVTLLAGGIGLWLELVNSPPLAPRLPHPQRAAIAAFAMWFTWAVAYVLGFTNHGVLTAYTGPGRTLSLIADQEVTVALVWAVAGFCFVPVIIATLGHWLTQREDPDEEFQRVVRDQANRVTVKGWGRRTPAGKGDMP